MPYFLGGKNLILLVISTNDSGTEPNIFKIDFKWSRMCKKTVESKNEQTKKPKTSQALISKIYFRLSASQKRVRDLNDCIITFIIAVLLAKLTLLNKYTKNFH